MSGALLYLVLFYHPRDTKWSNIHQNLSALFFLTDKQTLFSQLYVVASVYVLQMWFVMGLVSLMWRCLNQDHGSINQDFIFFVLKPVFFLEVWVEECFLSGITPDPSTTNIAFFLNLLFSSTVWTAKTHPCWNLFHWKRNPKQRGEAKKTTL